MAEDRRIALAALAVTAAVGLAAPLGAVYVTNNHDRNRLRAERAQADRADLRRVLDEAAAALIEGTSTLRDVTGASARSSYIRGQHTEVLPLSEKALKPLSDVMLELRKHHTRLAIRLGDRPGPAEFDTALKATGRVVLLLAGDGPERGVVLGAVDEATQELDRTTRTFIRAAYRVARSTTD